MPAFHLPSGTAYLVITTVTGTIYTILVGLIRVFIRLKINPPFAWDDFHCGIATAFTLLDAALVLAQTAYGIGHHASALAPGVATTQRILRWLAALCYIQASTFSLLSITFLIIRVTRLTSHSRPAYIVAGVTALWSLTATFVICFQCRLPAPWKTRPHGRCIDLYHAWLFITAARSVLEAANVFLAIALLWNLRMPLRPKANIVGLFALRLLCIPPALTRLGYLKISWHSTDWSYARINVQIITQVALHVSTILATVPCVKNFLLVFDSGNLHPRASTQFATTVDGGPSQRVSRREASSYTLRTMISRPTLDITRRAKSAFDVRPKPMDDTLLSPDRTATRPGPMHTLRMNTWSAPDRLNVPSLISSTDAPYSLHLPTPIPGSPGSQTLSTAEHDPVDARSAALERRMSADSDESRRRIKRTRSFTIDYWRGQEDSRRRSEDGMERSAARPGRENVQERKGSHGSLASVEEEWLDRVKAEV